MRDVSRSPRVSTVVDDRLHGDLVVAADREIVFALALPRPVEDQRRDAAIEIGPLVGVGLFLRGVEADRHDQHRRLRDACRLAQDAVERLALVGDRDALARRIEMRQRSVAALDRLHVRGLHLRHVVHEQELAEVVVDAGALQMLARADELPVGQRLAPHRLVHGGLVGPGAAPVVPAGDAGGHLLEIGERHAVRDETRRPMRDRGLDQCVHGWPPR